MTDDIQAGSADFETVKQDAKRLIGDVTGWITGASADMKQKWDEARPELEGKLAAAEAEAKRVGSASAGAANEMGKGIMGAFEELKKSFGEAQKHFRKDSNVSSDSTEQQ